MREAVHRSSRTAPQAGRGHPGVSSRARANRRHACWPIARGRPPPVWAPAAAPGLLGERFSCRPVEQSRPGALCWKLALYEPAESHIVETQAVEGVHWRKQHASRLPQDDRGGSHPPLEPGNKAVEGLRPAAEQLLGCRHVAQVASEELRSRCRRRPGPVPTPGREDDGRTEHRRGAGHARLPGWADAPAGHRGAGAPGSYPRRCAVLSHLGCCRPSGCRRCAPALLAQPTGLYPCPVARIELRRRGIAPIDSMPMNPLDSTVVRSRSRQPSWARWSRRRSHTPRGRVFSRSPAAGVQRQVVFGEHLPGQRQVRRDLSKGDGAVGRAQPRVVCEPLLDLAGYGSKLLLAVRCGACDDRSSPARPRSVHLKHVSVWKPGEKPVVVVPRPCTCPGVEGYDHLCPLRQRFEQS